MKATGNSLPSLIDIVSQIWLNMAMIKVKIGELRNNLSKYLRKVRLGAEVTITDRDHPVGKLVPMRKAGGREGLQMLPPKAGFEGLRHLRFHRRRHDTNVVADLLEDRHKR